MRARGHHPVPPRTGATALHAVVLDRYHLGELIGQGATARVYRARDARTDTDVAVKEILLQDGLARRVRSEVKAAARLSHPSIARLLDWGQEGATVYLAWELVDGAALSELLMSRRPPGAVRMLRIMADVLDGLAHAHSRDVVHRDVKPANVLVGHDGRARLADFGVARLVDEGRFTRSGVTVGTMAYMSPEQATGADATGATDVYAACLVLYEGLTGANPLAAGNPVETARRAASAAVPDLAKARPDLPRRVTAAVTAGLSRDPAGRPRAGALARLFREEARRMAAPSRRRAAGGRLPALVAGAGVIGVAVGAGASWPTTLAAIVGTAAACLLSPVVAVGLVALLAALTLLGALPGVALLGALAGGAAALPVRRHPLLLVAPLAGAAALLVGAGPLGALVAGGLRGHVRRVWATVSGGALALSWQLTVGGHGLLLAEVPIDPSAARGGSALGQALAPLGEFPGAILGLGVMMCAALAVPWVLRWRGMRRLGAAAAWLGAFSLLVGTIDGVGTAAAVVAPLTVLGLTGWVLAGVARSPRRAPVRASGTLGPVR